MTFTIVLDTTLFFTSQCHRNEINDGYRVCRACGGSNGEGS